MTDTIARLRSGKLIFETVVDLDNALKSVSYTHLTLPTTPYV